MKSRIAVLAVHLSRSQIAREPGPEGLTGGVAEMAFVDVSVFVGNLVSPNEFCRASLQNGGADRVGVGVEDLYYLGEGGLLEVSDGDALTDMDVTVGV